jgi:hypothetical protein
VPGLGPVGHWLLTLNRRNSADDVRLLEQHKDRTLGSLNALDDEFDLARWHTDPKRIRANELWDRVALRLESGRQFSCSNVGKKLIDRLLSLSPLPQRSDQGRWTGAMAC